jgi:hypothetical protein
MRSMVDGPSAFPALQSGELPPAESVVWPGLGSFFAGIKTGDPSDGGRFLTELLLTVTEKG